MIVSLPANLKSFRNRFLCQSSIRSLSWSGHPQLVASRPYNLVRYPSYLALYGDYSGSVAILISYGSYFREYVPFVRAMACACSRDLTDAKRYLRNWDSSHCGNDGVCGMAGRLLYIERQLAGRR